MPRAWHKDPPPVEDDGIPSKTRRKQEMHALQDLGERLAELTADKLAQLELPERLAIAINEYRRFNKWEAKRRQMQYIGRLMRDIDAAPIIAQLDIWAGTSRAAVAGFHAVEEWRDRLLAEAGALDALIAAHPEAERARLALLIDRARAEREGGRPPANFRLLFRELARLLDADQRAAAKTAATTPAPL
jgi:ribosome-associated protein